MNESKNELKIELSCGRCGFTKVISIGLDEDGVFTIPNKFCPNDLNELDRDVLRSVLFQPESVGEVVQVSDKELQIIVDKNAKIKPNEPTEDKTESPNAIPRPTRILEVPKHGANRSEKTKRQS